MKVEASRGPRTRLHRKVEKSLSPLLQINCLASVELQCFKHEHKTSKFQHSVALKYVKVKLFLWAINQLLFHKFVLRGWATDPSILSLGNRWRLIASFIQQPHHPRGNPLPPSQYIGCCVDPRAGLKFMEGDTILSSSWSRTRTPSLPACIPSRYRLSYLCFAKIYVTKKSEITKGFVIYSIENLTAGYRPCSHVNFPVFVVELIAYSHS
jgi:hypothetical protein